MDPGDVRLPAASAARLSERAAALLPLGTLTADAAPADPAAAAALAELAERLRNTYPYPDPEYAGQMLKPPAPVAWAAYATAMLLNPNNHALDGGPATAEMEREAVDALGDMLGVPSPRLGHLTSSGTIANLEALWIARELTGGATVVSSESAHYTHSRMCGVLGVAHESIAQDERGRMDLDALAARLRAGGVGTVVATLGTTSLGALDDVGAIADLCAAHGARLHVDTAYGGFFALLADGGEPGRRGRAVRGGRARGLGRDRPAQARPAALRVRLRAVRRPRRRALLRPRLPVHLLHLARPAPGRDQPRVLARGSGRRRAVDDAARAAADARGPRARTCRPRARRGCALAARLGADPRVAVLVEPELDIVCCLARRDDASAAAERAFAALAADGWHVATLRAGTAWARRRHPWLSDAEPTVTALRCCLLKREHLGVVDPLAEALGAALAA